MRICGVIASLGAGGAERVMTELCAAWATRGDDVTLLTLDDGRHDFYAVPTGVHRRALDLASRSRTANDALRANVLRARVMRAALRAARPDVVVSFTDRTNVLTLLAARGLSVPVVVSERIDPRHHDIGRAWSLLRRLTYPSASALVVQTEAVRRWADDIVSPARVAVIPNPLRPIAGPTTAAGARDHIVVALGRLVPQKGFDVLIRAFAMLASEFPSWQLRILGEGPERSALQSLVDTLGLVERVTMPGRTADPDRALGAAAVFALPSRYEGFPNALLEAMSQGCACVATRCDSGPSDLLADDAAGCLVPVGDVLHLAETMAMLMEDGALRTRLGGEAQRAATRFAPAVVLSAWDAVLSTVRTSSRMAA
ncbi:MAG: glycosyltransferase family 4 protein [Gemmatimonadaceae bacterium]|nr:glycosyltransferase family 4 protein [Gemmatimonadaceae bacterium]